MDKSSVKFWLLFDLKRYIASCSDAFWTAITITLDMTLRTKGHRSRGSVGTMAALFQRPFTAPAAYQILAWWLSD